MQELQIPDKTNADMERFYKQLFDSALGNIIDLSAAPGPNTLQATQIGAFGTDIYIVTPTGNRIKLSGTSW